MVSAISSFPVPLSPVINTLALVLATRCAVAKVKKYYFFLSFFLNYQGYYFDKMAVHDMVMTFVDTALTLIIPSSLMIPLVLATLCAVAKVIIIMHI